MVELMNKAMSDGLEGERTNDSERILQGVSEFNQAMGQSQELPAILQSAQC
jgi:hypothetical protein